MMRSTLIVSLAFAVLGCREEAGEPVYPEFEVFVNDDFLPGPFPFEDGDERLFVGEFYEGLATEAIEIDGVNNNYFIFEGTYSQAVSDDRVEGLQSAEIEVSGAQVWWGGGIIWGNALDLTGWTTMHISLKADDALFEATDVGVQSGGADQVVRVSDFGFIADGEWHNLVIPVATLPGVNLASVTSPLLLLSTEGTPGSTILVDDLYFTKE